MTAPVTIPRPAEPGQAPEVHPRRHGFAERALRVSVAALMQAATWPGAPGDESLPSATAAACRSARRLS